VISCRALTRRFGSFTAVDNLTFDIPSGSVCAFMGPNGAGKSTTLNMLTGLLAPTSGDAAISGLSVVAAGSELKRNIGVLPANLGLFDDLTVEEHLDLTGRIYGLPDATTRDRAAQLLRVLDLEHGRRVFAGNCSSGMRKKTALAMAMIHNPPVLFLDEPFEAIDPMTARTIGELMARFAARGGTVFLTSHILSALEKLATRFIIIRGGKIARDFVRGELERSLEELYFELIELAPVEDLEWLGSARS
jgi:ABC-2 type transport system ATP-binding protein